MLLLNQIESLLCLATELPFDKELVKPDETAQRQKSQCIRMRLMIRRLSKPSIAKLLVC